MNQTYIFNRFTYITKKIKTLTLSVDAFKSTLVANTNCPNACVNNYTLTESDCSCKCFLSCTNAQISNWRYCQCVDFSEAPILNSLDGKITDLFVRVSYDTVNSTVTTDYLTRIYALQDRLYDYTANLEYYVTEVDLTTQATIIHHYEELITSITNEYEEYVSSETPCPSGCDSSYQVQVSDCSCFESVIVDDYYSLLDKFVVLEYDIQRYGGAGNSIELAAFAARAADIRKLFQELYETFFNSPDHYDVAVAQSLVDQIAALTTQLDEDFNNWKDANIPVTFCTLSCSPSEIQNLKDCICVNIVDWDKLPEVQNGLDHLDDDINNLDIDPVNKQKLLDNW